jgi:hypothetical protein
VQRDRGSRRHLLAGIVVEDAGEDANFVGLLALGCEPGLAGAALVEVNLEVGGVEWNSGWATIDDAANCGAVALAPGGNTEEVAEGIVGHG